MDLLTSFREYIYAGKLFSPTDTLLIAVSGGVDSVVLCELCHRAGYRFEMAHANFQLRGAESERDEIFVRRLATRYGVTVHIRRFETLRYADENHCSIQMAARDLRYAWFYDLLGVHGTPSPSLEPASPSLESASPGVLLTAHHLDDNIETILINFFKGTGIAGLHGILPRQGLLARPLLFAHKAALVQFARDQGLTWVEDSSNHADVYTRNAIRHQLMPVLERIWPGVTDNLSANIERFREVEELYRQALDRQIGRLAEPRGEEVHVPVLKLKQADPLHTIVFELIRPYGFTPRQTGEVLRLLDSGSGKYILSPTHRILRDRKWIIISPLKSEDPAHILIPTPSGVMEYNGGLLEWGITATPQLATSPDTAMLDASQIQFPLLLRKWRPGDYFYPLGMRKKKKLARFFIDSKLSLAEKEKTWVIEMDRKIIWVVGRRIDERFKVTGTTRSILRIESRMG